MSLDIIDKLGTHIVDYNHDLTLTSRDGDGKQLWQGRMDNRRPTFKTVGELLDAFNSGRSCLI